MDSIPLHWCVSNNIGDALNYWLVKKITNKDVYWVPKNTSHKKFICIGSILNWADENCTVWGAGLANQTDVVNNKADIRCVRGPLSAQIASECGVFNADSLPWGDPALLVSKYYKGKHICKHKKVGLIPHYADYHVLKNIGSLNQNFKLINVFDSIESIADQIKRCQVILSSSLHGLVLADAYNTPNMQIKISDHVLGDGMKFKDYLMSVERTHELPINIFRILKYDPNSIVELVRDKYEPIELNYIQKQLLESCPFV